MSNYYNRQWRLPNNENKSKQSNYSLDFDGSSQYIDCSNSPAITGDFSISLWINQTSTNSTFAYLIEQNGAKLRIGVNNNNTIYFQLSSNNMNSTTAITNGSWVHLVFIKSGTSMNIYINNTAQTQATAPSSHTISSTNLYIGSHSGNTYPFYGQIDGVAIFDYALSASQITTLYGSSSNGIGNPMSLPAPVAYYPLGDQDSFNGSNYLVPNSSLKDYVFSFDGSNDTINFGTSLNSVLNGYSSSFTISCWINASDSSNRKGIISNYTGIGTYIDLINVSSTTFKLQGGYHTTSASSGFVLRQNNTNLNINNWYNIVLVVSSGGASGSVDIYVNGSLDNGVEYHNTTQSYTNTNNLYISTNLGYQGNFFNGKISNAQVFNTALPATGSNSVETLYNNGSPLTSMSGFTSLQGWWKLDASATYDGTNWSIPDSSSNSNTGTSSGMSQSALQQSDLSFKTSISPFALNFDGVNDLITISNESNFDFDRTDSFSISCWFKCDNVSVTNHLINKYSASGSYTGYYLFVNSGGQLKFYLRNHYSPSNQIIITSSSNIVNDVWYNFIITYNGSSNASGCKIYIDASDVSQINTDTLSSSILNDEPLRIGGRSPASDMANGQISNVSIWNAALTSAQVTEIYSEGIPQNLLNHSAVSSLVSWWQLGSNSSFNSSLNQWTCIDEKGTNTGESSQTFDEDAIVDGVGSYANGLSSGMGGDEVIGDAPYSSSNSLSVNMDALDRVEDTPS